MIAFLPYIKSSCRDRAKEPNKNKSRYGQLKRRITLTDSTKAAIALFLRLEMEIIFLI